MARSTIVVEKWVYALGWQFDKGFPGAAILAALAHAKDLERTGVRARIYERTPDGPKGIYETKR